MNGIFIVDKPQGFTSFDVVAKMRGICQTKKIGHGGTLDPMATGVLPVFVGRAVKAVDLAPQQGKAYEAQILFGVATDTGDITGNVIKKVDKTVTMESLQEVLPQFLGEQTQLPPMYSAVKVNGTPLYKYAREGKSVERKTRQVTINEIVLRQETDKNKFGIFVSCSKGTYIRSLCEDIGAKLGTVATLASLQRTKSGVFTIDKAITLADIQAAKDAGVLGTLAIEVDSLFAEYPSFTVNEKAAQRLQNGAPLYGIKGTPGTNRIYKGEDVPEFLGLGDLQESGEMKISKLFAVRDQNDA